VFWKLAVFVPK